MRYHQSKYSTEIQFIIDNYEKMSAHELASKLNIGFDVVKRIRKHFVYDVNDVNGINNLPGFVVIKKSPIHAINADGDVIRIRTHQKVKPSPNRKGYLQVCLQNAKSHRVHRLVAEAFIPNPENKPQVNHIDGDKLNNHVCNLEWVTSQENASHAIKLGLWDSVAEKVAISQTGENNSSAKLKESDVLEIYQALSSGVKVGVLAKRYNVNHANICAIKSGKSWKYLHSTYFKVQRPERNCS